MQLVDHEIELEREDQPVWLHAFGDIHRAALGCDHRQLRSDINRLKHAVEVKKEKHVWLGHGDWLNAIGHTDKRYEAAAISPQFLPYVADDLFHQECNVLVSEFRPIRDYGIGLGDGNHEATICKQGGFNPMKDIASRLNLPYIGYSAGIRLVLRAPNKVAVPVMIHYHHGVGASATKGGKLNMLYKMRDKIAADIYIVGHVHELIGFKQARLSLPAKGKLRLEHRQAVFINGGTYLKTYEVEPPQEKQEFDTERHVRYDYGERKAYDPTIIGHNGVRINIQRDHIKRFPTFKLVDFQ
jgi:hypothetical protein